MRNCLDCGEEIGATEERSVRCGVRGASALWTQTPYEDAKAKAEATT